MSDNLENKDETLLKALSAVEYLLIRALDLLDEADQPTVLAAEIDLALHHLRLERDALNQAASAS